jgi:hypothetical protein
VLLDLVPVRTSTSLIVPVQEHFSIQARRSAHPPGEKTGLEEPGAWMSEYQFAREVSSALTRIIHILGDNVELESEPRFENQRPDALVRSRDHIVVVEAKKWLSQVLRYRLMVHS